MRYFKTLQDILEFKAGTVIEFVVDDLFSMGRLGSFGFGWDIPLFIVLKNPEWFQEIQR
jgi:hypothetical protein